MGVAVISVILVTNKFKMNKFRCPGCKNEVIETKFIHIKSIFCKQCRLHFIKIYKPNNKILKFERKINKMIYKNPKIVVTPKFLETFK